MSEFNERFLLEVREILKPGKLNDNSLKIGEKYSIMAYSPREGFQGDYYIIYCKTEDGIITSFYSNTKINKKIEEYKMNWSETLIYKIKKKEFYEVYSPIKFTLGEIKKFEGKNIKYREIFFK